MKLFIFVISASISFIFFLKIFSIIKKKRKTRRYYQLLRTYYAENAVLQALEKVNEQMHEPIIDKAISYLKYFPIKDYKSAFRIIEREICTNKINGLHERILEIEQRHMIFWIGQKY